MTIIKFLLSKHLDRDPMHTHDFKYSHRDHYKLRHYKCKKCGYKLWFQIGKIINKVKEDKDFFLEMDSAASCNEVIMDEALK